MKTKIIALLFVLTTSTATFAQNSDENTQSNGKNYYGEKITEDGIISVNVFKKQIDNKTSDQIKLSGEILGTCQMKGCWMDVKLADNTTMKVTFKDYGFFVPKMGLEGKETIIQGYAEMVETDVATLKHYAQDAGKSQEEIDKIKAPQKEISFVATGVIIKD